MLSGGRTVPLQTSSSSPAFQKRWTIPGREGDGLARPGALLGPPGRC